MTAGEQFWPDGKVAAAAFTFDVDAESAVLWGQSHNARRMSVISHQAYGPLVGVPRILQLLDRHGIRATFFVPGYTARRYPDTVKNIAAAGHEIGHHGYLHEQPSALTPEEQRTHLQEGFDALSDAAGVRPVGFRAPMWDLGWDTPALLHEFGFLYDSSLMDADRPYELAVGPGQPPSIVEIPIHWVLDDWERYCYLPDISGSGLIENPRQVRALWWTEFEALRAAGGCWVLTNHPFLSGRPGRARERDTLVSDVVSCPDVWVTTLSDIAEHVRKLALPPRSVEACQDA